MGNPRTHSNLSGLSEEVDGHKGLLLVWRLWALGELRCRWGICPGPFISHHSCWLKKYSQPKSWSRSYLVGFFRISGLGDRISSSPELWGREGKKEREGREDPANLNTKRLLLKKIRYLKLRNLVLFYIWKVARVRAHWNHFFPMHLSYPGQCPVFFTSWAPLGFTLGSGGSHLLRALRTHAGGLQIVHDCDIHVYWCGRKYFSSQPFRLD